MYGKQIPSTLVHGTENFWKELENLRYIFATQQLCDFKEVTLMTITIANVSKLPMVCAALL